MINGVAIGQTHQPATGPPLIRPGLTAPLLAKKVTS
jgi:hypothetical protein